MGRRGSRIPPHHSSHQAAPRPSPSSGRHWSDAVWQHGPPRRYWYRILKGNNPRRLLLKGEEHRRLPRPVLGWCQTWTRLWFAPLVHGCKTPGGAIPFVGTERTTTTPPRPSCDSACSRCAASMMTVVVVVMKMMRIRWKGKMVHRLEIGGGACQVEPAPVWHGDSIRSRTGEVKWNYLKVSPDRSLLFRSSLSIYSWWVGGRIDAGHAIERTLCKIPALMPAVLNGGFPEPRARGRAWGRATRRRDQCQKSRAFVRYWSWQRWYRFQDAIAAHCRSHPIGFLAQNILDL